MNWKNATKITDKVGGGSGEDAKAVYFRKHITSNFNRQLFIFLLVCYCFHFYCCSFLICFLLKNVVDV